MRLPKIIGLALLLTTKHLLATLPTNYKLIIPQKKWINRYIETIGQIQVLKKSSSNQLQQGTIYSRNSSPYIMPLFSYPKISKRKNIDLLSQTSTGEYSVVFYQPHHLLNTLKEIQNLSPLKVEIFLSHQDPYPYLSEISSIEESERNKQMITLTAKYMLDPKNFRPNDYIHVRLYTSKEKLFSLPKECIFKDSKGHYIYLAPPNRNSLEKEYVKIGQDEGSEFVILQGLNSDSVVVLPLSD